MKNLVNKGFKYFVAIMMVFSLMSMNAWANGPESGTSSETGSTTTENKGTTKDTGDSQGDTADQLISNEEKKTNTSKESDDKEGQTDQITDKKTDYTYEDNKISVKAVLANASAISDQAELRVKEIPESTTEYKKYQEALNKKSNLYSNVLLYDISFILDGKEVEPTDGNVKVSMSFKDQQLSDDLNVKDNNDLKVIHFKDNDVNKQETLDASTNVNKGTTSFETKSFSAFAVVTDNNKSKNAKIYKVNNFSVPDYGYGVTAVTYNQRAHLETTVFVDNYYSFGQPLIGSTQAYSNAGGCDYIGNIVKTSEKINFQQQPKKVYLGQSAYKTYKDNPNILKVNDKVMDKRYVEKNLTMNATQQIKLMAQQYINAFDNKKTLSENNDLADSISLVGDANNFQNSNDDRNHINIDLTDQNAGSYLVVYDGNFIKQAFNINIKENQRLIFYCTASGSFSMKSYTLNTYDDTGKMLKSGTSANYIANNDSKLDWTTEAVSFYMPNITDLKFEESTCGVFIAPSAKFDTSASSAGVIAVNEFNNSGGEWHYQNHHLPTPTDVQFKGEKKFINDKWPDSGNYTLHLSAINDAPIPSDGTSLVLSKSLTSGKFSKITYPATANSSLFNKSKYYYYKIEELEDSPVSNVKYDQTVYYVKVKVDYSGDGSAIVNGMYKMTENPFDPKGNNIGGKKWTSFEETDPFIFTNTYNTFSANASLAIKKTVNGSTPGDKKFNFNLDEGSLDSDRKFDKSKNIQENATNDINGNVTFNELNYTEVGTHYYRIYETATTVDPAKDYVASGDIYAKVVIDQNSKAVITYYSDPQFSKEVMDPTINNQEKTYFQIRKYDADNQNKYLGGAVFELYKVKNIKNGQLIIDSYEDVKRNTSSTIEKYIGKTLFYDLLYGNTYVLKEVQAPDGYQISGPWLLEITDEGHMTLTKLTEYKEVNGKENTFSYVKSTDIKEQEAKVILNKPIGIGDKKIEYTLPSTGGIGTKKYYLLGTLLSMLGVIYIVMKLGKGGLFGKEDHS
ncbi:MAG TPA: hypothetical protein HA255_04190 [Methanosphaera sp.]|nr:hypothetical protein [Methanosphaera sp.]